MPSRQQQDDASRAASSLLPDGRERGRFAGAAGRLLGSRKVTPLFAAITLQALLLLATAGILVFRAPPEPVRFVPVSTATVTPRALERQSLLSQMARAQSHTTPDVIALPPDKEQTLPSHPAFDISAAATYTAPFSPVAFGTSASFPGTDTSFAATTGWGDAIGNVLEATAAVQFFGIEEQAQRYLILLDTSNSMFVRSRSGIRYRYDFGRIKTETARLIDSFNANTLFNIILYEGGAKAWQETLLPASTATREAASQWVHAIGENPSLSIRDRKGAGPLLSEGGGTRLDTALKLAFSNYDPQVVFIVTDGEINSIPGGRIREEVLVEQLRQLQNAQKEPARVHVIHYQTAQMREAELQTMQAIARQGRGKFIQIIAAEQ